MPIDGRGQLIEAMPGAAIVAFQKLQATGQVVGGMTSFWRIGGFPIIGAIPTTPAICTKATTGALVPWSNPAAGVVTKLSRVSVQALAAPLIWQFHDRLVHMGGLSGGSTGIQTVDLDASVTGGNMVLRRGESDYSELNWWLEWYAVTGGGVATATVAYTYNDNSTDTTAIALSSAVPISRLYEIVPSTAGKYIKSIQSVTLGANTGLVGNFGVTATRRIAAMLCGNLPLPQAKFWNELAMPQVHDDACLTFHLSPSVAATGALQGYVHLVQR